MNTVDRVRAVREAAMVERCHTVPHLRSYTNGAHTYGVCVLLRMFWPDEPKLVDFALFHDTPERWTGDMPSQVIRAHPELKKSLKKEDERIAAALSIPTEHDMEPLSYMKFKACDRLDLWLWTWEEEAMGNKMVLGVRRALDELFADSVVFTPDIVIEFMKAFRAKGWKRLEEVI